MQHGVERLDWPPLLQQEQGRIMVLQALRQESDCGPLVHIFAILTLL